MGWTKIWLNVGIVAIFIWVLCIISGPNCIGDQGHCSWYLPIERIFAWLGAWALGFSFFFSSSPLFSFESRTGTLLSSFFFFLSRKKHNTVTNGCKERPLSKQTNDYWNNRCVPAGELLLLETLWDRIVAIQPSTSTDANFLNSKNKR